MREGSAVLGKAARVATGVLVALSVTAAAPGARAEGILPEYRYDQLASDDVSVSASTPSTNTASSDTLVTAAGVRTYVRIEVTQRARQLTLRLFALADGPGSNVYLTSGEWTEAEITATTAPPLGQFAGKIGPAKRGQWVSLDITGAVCRPAILMGCRPGVYAFVLTAAGGKTAYASNEHWLQAGPRLVVRVT